ncbi:CDC27 protein [Conoideocrella luteorostrata]|uniref:DNA polymerase delta subunit 3 n=1 Tax=Conoideocrella luteorostrata TaxID=1105319 RepID=A0AAJ0FVM6_9HYPO|nr:CDC27 protein [Conoideocrella luteorostrata]
MDEHRKFLADRLLSEEQPVTYRNVSRSLDVHVNVAKGILFEFYQYQNGQRQGSIHATYLVCGISTLPYQATDDADQSGASSQLDNTYHAARINQLALVGEENLQEILGAYQTVTSIHIYSLSPIRIKDFWLHEVSTHTDCERLTHKEKHHITQNNYGAIHNPYVRARDRKFQPMLVSSTQTIAAKPVAQQADPGKKKALEPSPNDSQQSVPSAVRSTSSFKRPSTGNILQSFMKSNPTPPNRQAEPAQQTDMSATALSDDGEADDSDHLPSKPTSHSGPNFKSRTEREEGLRRMMEEEESSEDLNDAEESASDHVVEEQPVPELEPVPVPAVNTVMQAKNESLEVISSSGDGRRRGKRRVLQKKRILDEQGYMVTIQEPGWESFSEDDNSQPPSKKTTLTSTTSSSAARVKKPAGKGAQGSIMSFFGRK